MMNNRPHPGPDQTLTRPAATLSHPMGEGKARENRSPITSSRLQYALALAFLLLARLCQCQDIEPRRWSHLPIGGNFGGVAYAYTTGDI